MIKKLCLLFLMLTFIGCPKEGQLTNVAQPGNESFNVIFLFEIDNVKLYRFTDAGHYRYFTTGCGKFMPQQQPQRKTTYTDGAN